MLLRTNLLSFWGWKKEDGTSRLILQSGSWYE